MLVALYALLYLAIYGWTIFVAVDVIEVVAFFIDSSLYFTYSPTRRAPQKRVLV